MKGGGFLKVGADSAKQNRESLKKTIDSYSKPKSRTEGLEITVESREVSAEERTAIVNRIMKQSSVEGGKRAPIALAITFLIGLVVYLFFVIFF